VSAPAADGADDESRHRQLTVLAGWRRFVDEEPAPPELLPDQEWRRLGDAGLLAYDEARLNHHSRLLVVATPVIRKVITEGRRLSYLNRNADSGRCGLILSGPARTGKTTAITQLGKTLEVIHRQRRPRSGNDIPVLYVTVPPAATAKMIAVEFARFPGLPAIPRANLTDITEAVCGICTDTGTELVAVDEIHNVSLATRPGAEASDMLKYFSERRHRRRAQRPPFRHPRRADRRPLRHDQDQRVPPRRVLDRAGLRPGRQPPPAPPPARHPGRARGIPPPPHRRHDRQPAPHHPRRSHPGRPRRLREDHPRQPRLHRRRYRVRDGRRRPAPPGSA